MAGVALHRIRIRRESHFGFLLSVRCRCLKFPPLVVVAAVTRVTSHLEAAQWQLLLLMNGDGDG